jgi:uncharacterized membrane protein HdeD (DUF308 family)
MSILTAPSPLVTAAKKFGGSWWILLIVGIAWIVIGFVVLRFDTSTVYVISVVFGVLLLLSAVNEIFRATITLGGWRIWHILFTVLLVIGAIIAFVNPGATFESLAIVVGIYFVFVGTYDIITSLFSISLSPIWWLQLLSGIAELVLGFLASSSFSSGVVVLVTYVSVLAIFRGVAEIGAAFTVRQLTKTAS